jgi:hypothetical protein
LKIPNLFVKQIVSMTQFVRILSYFYPATG